MQEVMDGNVSEKAAEVGMENLRSFLCLSRTALCAQKRIALDMDLTETSVYVDEEKDVTVIEEKYVKIHTV